MKKIYGWTAALVLLSYVSVGIFLTLAPDRLPTHYGVDGAIDGWGSKYTYLLLPFFSTLMGVTLTAVGRYEGRHGRKENEGVVLALGLWVQVLFNVLWIVFLVMALRQAPLPGGSDLGVKIILVLTMASLIPLGNIMPRARRNSLFGLRTSWSMADDVCWQKSQRFGGYLLVGSGMLGVAVTCLLPADLGSLAMLVIMAVTILLAVLGSYMIWKKEQRKEV